MTNRWNAKLTLFQLIILVRHFFRRLFLNETIFFEEQMLAKVISVIAILSIFPGYVADALLFKYLLEPDTVMVPAETAWVEMFIFICLIMLIIGLITLFVWETIFLDRRDYLNFMPLPIKGISLFGAKFLSLIMFVGLFALGLNSISSFVFAIYLGQSRKYGLISEVSLFLIHLLVMMAAAIFIFFALACIFGFLNFLLRKKIFCRLSDLLRFGYMIATFYLLYLFILDNKFIKNLYENISSLKANPTRFIMSFPPFWFTGLYQVLLGSNEAFFRRLAFRALLALAATIGIFFLLTLITYNRYSKNVFTEETRYHQSSFLKNIFEIMLRASLLRNPTERASCWFYVWTLTRSRLHRTRIVSYFVVGAGMAIIFFISVGSYFWKYQSGNMLSLPLILSFFLLLGVKDSINLPSNYEANWVFRLTENESRWIYFKALRKSVFIYILLPLYALIFGFYCLFWPILAATLHCLYQLAWAVLLMEILFFQRRKIPFVCSYLPGKSKLYVFWLVYVLLFLAYIYIPRWLETYFLASASRFILFYAIFFLIVGTVWIYHKFHFYPKKSLFYEENPEPVMIELSPSI